MTTRVVMPTDDGWAIAEMDASEQITVIRDVPFQTKLPCEDCDRLVWMLHQTEGPRWRCWPCTVRATVGERELELVLEEFAAEIAEHERPRPQMRIVAETDTHVHVEIGPPLPPSDEEELQWIRTAKQQLKALRTWLRQGRHAVSPLLNEASRPGATSPTS